MGLSIFYGIKLIYYFTVSLQLFLLLLLLLLFESNEIFNFGVEILSGGGHHVI